MAPRKSVRTSNDMPIDSDLSNFNPDDYIKTAHNSRLYRENQNLKKQVKELVEYQIAHPKLAKPTTREEIDNEKKVALEIEIKKKYIRAQLAVIKTLYRSSVMKVREEKEQTARSRSHNDGLILGLNNLKYEEQSLRSEILAAENHDHKYKKLPLVPVEAFLQEFPEHEGASEHDLMTARIEHEHQVRVKLEERRQEKLKQKQKLIAEVKKGKDDLTKLDGMVEKFIEAAEPISKALATERPDYREIMRNIESAVEPVLKTKSFPQPALKIQSPTAHEPKIMNVPMPRKKLTLQEKLECEGEIAKEAITPTATVTEASKVLIDRFGPVFARVVEHYVPDSNIRSNVYTELASQFSKDMERYMTEKGDKKATRL